VAEIYKQEPSLKTAAEHFSDLAGAGEDLGQDTRERSVDVGGGGEGPAAGPQVVDTPTVGQAAGPGALTIQAPAGYSPNHDVQGIYSRYFSPLSEGLGKLSGGLGEARTTFQTGAEGGRNVYSEGVLQAGIQPGGVADAEELEDARKLVNATYTGPLGLGDVAGTVGTLEGTPELDVGYQGLTDRSRALRSQVGLQAILGESVPGLTSGQRKEEARRVLRERAFQAGRRAIGEDLGAFGAELGGARAEATSFAVQRAGEEAGVQSQARAFVEGQGEGIRGDVGETIAAREAEDARLQAIWQSFQDTGELEALLGAPVTDVTSAEGELVGKGPLNVQNLLNEVPEIQRGRDAEAAQKAIMERYQDLGDVPLMTLGVGAKGREKLFFPDEWYAANKARADLPAIRERAIARQQELEGLFAPGTGKRGNDGQNLNFDAQYADVNPLYFGGAFESEDPRTKSYSDLLPGVSANLGNSSSAEQQGALQNIENLMGRAALTFETDPYKAAQIVFQVDSFLKNEHDKIAAQKGEISENQNQWRRIVKKAREGYKNSGFFHAVGNVLRPQSPGKAPPKVGKVAQIMGDVIFRNKNPRQVKSDDRPKGKS
jgi:hypothetical protein